MHPFNFEFIFQVLILKLIICCLHTKGPNIHSYWCQIQELKVKLQQNVKMNEQFLFSVKEDTLSDMVDAMKENVGLVHQMPYTCDGVGLPSTLEKVTLCHEKWFK